MTKRTSGLWTPNRNWALPSRRDVLRYGLGAGAAAAALPSALAGTGTGTGTKKTPTKLIVVFASAGWDTSMSLDPQFDNPDVEGPQVDQDPADPNDIEYIGTWGGIQAVCNDVKRPSIKAFFDSYAQYACVLKGLWTGAIAHDPARIRILTGTASLTNPAWGTIFGAVKGKDFPLGSVDVSGLSYSGSLAATTGMIGYNAQIKALVDMNSSYRAPAEFPLPYPYFVPDSDDQDAIRQFLSDRLTTYRGAFADGGHNDKQFDDRIEATDRARRFRDESTDAISALKLGSTPSLETQADLACDLLQQGVCKMVTIDSMQPWDTHTNNVDQHFFHERCYQGLMHLAERMVTDGMMEDTLVVVLSEMSRTPKRNAALGKDHWPHACWLLWGAGIPHLTTVGETDMLVESMKMDLATGELNENGQYNKYDNMAAGLLDLLDVDPAEWYPDVEVFRGLQYQA